MDVKVRRFWRMESMGDPIDFLYEYECEYTSQHQLPPRRRIEATGRGKPERRIRLSPARLRGYRRHGEIVTGRLIA